MHQVRAHLALRITGLAIAAYGAAMFLAALADLCQWLVAAGLFTDGLRPLMGWWDGARIGTINAATRKLIPVIAGLATLLFGRWLFFSPRALAMATARVSTATQENKP